MNEPAVIFLLGTGLLIIAAGIRKWHKVNSQRTRRRLWKATTVEPIDQLVSLPDMSDVS